MTSLREQAARRCFNLNEARADALVIKATTPTGYEDQATAFIAVGEFLAAAKAYEYAAEAAQGRERRAMYQHGAMRCRELNAERYNEAYPCK